MSDPFSLSPSLWLPLSISMNFFFNISLKFNIYVMSTISLLEATCCGVPILRHIPTYTDSDIFWTDNLMKMKDVILWLWFSFFNLSQRKYELIKQTYIFAVLLKSGWEFSELFFLAQIGKPQLSRNAYLVLSLSLWNLKKFWRVYRPTIHDFAEIKRKVVETVV